MTPGVVERRLAHPFKVAVAADSTRARRLDQRIGTP
jgi:hypothetical protein